PRQEIVIGRLVRVHFFSFLSKWSRRGDGKHSASSASASFSPGHPLGTTSRQVASAKPARTCSKGLPAPSALNSKRAPEGFDQLKPPSAFPTSSFATSRNPRQANTCPGLNRSTETEACVIESPPQRAHPRVILPRLRIFL